MDDLRKYCETEAKKADVNLIFTNKGIGYRIGNDVVLNENLLKYESFCKDVLDHELRHSKNYTKTDFLMDMFEGSLIQTLNFCIRNPRGFLQFIPIGKHKDTWFIDLNQIIIYLIYAAVIGGVLWMTM